MFALGSGICLSRLVLWLLVERVLAVVSGHPITLSEVEIEGRIVLARRGGIEALAVPMDDDFICATLEAVITQYLISTEADRLRLEPPSDVSVLASFDTFRRGFGDQAEYEHFLMALELSSSDLAAIISRHLRVERMIHNRIGGEVTLMPGEVSALMREQPDRFEDDGAARAHLLRQGQTRLLRQWVDSIAERVVVQYLDAGASGPRCAPGQR